MFDLSFAELFFVIVIALLVIGPEDLPKVVRGIRSLVRKMKSLSHELLAAFDQVDEIKTLKEESEKINQEIRHIVDLDGNIQEAYDVDELEDTSKQKRKPKK